MNPLIIITSIYTGIMSVQLNVWTFGHCLCFLFDAEVPGLVPKHSSRDIKTAVGDNLAEQDHVAESLETWVLVWALSQISCGHEMNSLNLTLP